MFFKNPWQYKTCNLTNFNNISNKEKQDIYISGLISLATIQRRRPKTGEGQQWAYSCHYKIKLGIFEHIVCIKAFCSLHGVGKAWVERIIHNLQDETPIPTDNRGKHQNRPFPSRSSHYSRNKNANVKYLSPDLHLRKMHKLYLQKYEPIMY